MPGSQACRTTGNAAVSITFCGVEKLGVLLAFHLPALG